MEIGGSLRVYMENTTTAPVINKTMAYFREECQKQGINSNMTLAVFYDWSYEEGAQIRWDVFTIVPENIEVKPPLKIAPFEKIKVLAYTYQGPPTVAEIEKTYKFLRGYLKEKGLQHTWPEYELFLKEPRRMNIFLRWKE